MIPVELGDIAIGGGRPLVLIAGPCVIESEQHATDLAGRLVEITRRGKSASVMVPPDWFEVAVAAISENKELKRQLANTQEVTG